MPARMKMTPEQWKEFKKKTGFKEDQEGGVEIPDDETAEERAEERQSGQGRSQNVKTSYIPKAHQDRRNLNSEIRNRQKPRIDREKEQNKNRTKFKNDHPTISKALDLGNQALQLVNRKTANFIEDNKRTDKKLKQVLGAVDDNLNFSTAGPGGWLHNSPERPKATYGHFAPNQFKSLDVPVSLHGIKLHEARGAGNPSSLSSSIGAFSPNIIKTTITPSTNINTSKSQKKKPKKKSSIEES